MRNLLCMRWNYLDDVRIFIVELFGITRCDDYDVNGSPQASSDGCLKPMKRPAEFAFVCLLVWLLM